MGLVHDDTLELGLEPASNYNTIQPQDVLQLHIERENPVSQLENCDMIETQRPALQAMHTTYCLGIFTCLTS